MHRLKYHVFTSNRACWDAEQRKKHEAHKKALRNMKPSIDTAPPTCMFLDHLNNNQNRQVQMEERYAEIDRCNRMLLQKMSDIMRSKGDAMPEQKTSGLRSLNKNYRKQKLIEITNANVQILKSIRGVKPSFDRSELDAREKEYLKHLKNACEYSLCLPHHKESKKQKKLDAETARAVQQRKAQSEIEKARAFVDSEQAANMAAAQQDLKCVLRESKKLDDNNYYLIEFATDGRNLTIRANGSDGSGANFELLVNEKNHRRFYADKEINGDYMKLAERLAIVPTADGGKMLKIQQSAPKRSDEIDADQMEQQAQPGDDVAQM